MEETIKALIGTITKVSQREKSYGILINDTWYNGFGKCPVQENQSVVIEFVQEEYQGKPSLKIKNIEPVNQSTEVKEELKGEEVDIVPMKGIVIASVDTAADLLAELDLKDEKHMDARLHVFRELMLDRRTQMIHNLGLKRK